MWRRLALGVGVGVSATFGVGSYASALQAADPAVRSRGTAVVTGGSRGIGAACSRALAAKGYNVVVVYRAGVHEARDVVADIVTNGGSAVAIQANVGDEAQVVRLFEEVDTWRGASPLRVLVNNAGILGPAGKDGGLQEITADSLAALLSVNTIGPAICIREAERRMSKAVPSTGDGLLSDHPRGSIVQISSGSAYIGSPLQYACSKGALNSLTIGLVKPLAQQGIRINTISPGMTATDMITDTLPTFDLSQIPLGRVGTPEEIANCVVWLCSDEASYVAGANIRVAGGRPPGTTLG